MKVYKPLSKNLIKLRYDKNLSQQQVADFLNIHRSSYCCYEKGKCEPNLSTLEKLCQLYNVDFNTLLDY